LEAGFDRLDGNDHPSFQDLDEAQDWIAQRLKPSLDRPS